MVTAQVALSRPRRHEPGARETSAAWTGAVSLAEEAKELGLLDQVSALAQETFGKSDVRALTKREASILIDELRGGPA